MVEKREVCGDVGEEVSGRREMGSVRSPINLTCFSTSRARLSELRISFGTVSGEDFAESARGFQTTFFLAHTRSNSESLVFYFRLKASPLTLADFPLKSREELGEGGKPRGKDGLRSTRARGCRVTSASRTCDLKVPSSHANRSKGTDEMYGL